MKEVLIRLVVLGVVGLAVHIVGGIWNRGLYHKTEHLWRKFSPKIFLGLVAENFVTAGIFLFLYHAFQLRYTGAPLLSGVGFGFFIGLIAAIPAALSGWIKMNVPGMLMLRECAEDLVAFTAMGLLAAWI